MKLIKRKLIAILLGLTFVVSLSILAIISTNDSQVAFAEDSETEFQSEEFVIEDYEVNISATYSFSKLNDSECSVRISNKSEATKAIIPATVEIDGKYYKVTEVAANGFASADKLIRVSLPYSIKKLGNMAFANCKSLKRISLANVIEIGNTTFYNCTSLEELIIPQSVVSLGSYILRNCNTQVKVRAEADGQNWAVNWNSNNKNQNVHYDSKVLEPLILEPIYNNSTRSVVASPIGYALAGGQPRTDNYYAINMDDGVDEYKKDNNIIIPAQNKDGVEIIAIDMFAFAGAQAEQIIIEYSEKPIKLNFNAFTESNVPIVVFNRDIKFIDYSNSDLNNNASDCIFADSMVEEVVLPDSLREFPTSMFAGCKSLTNIYFITVSDIIYSLEGNVISSDKIIEDARHKLNKDLNIEDSKGIIKLSQKQCFDTIGSSAFAGTAEITELHIYSNVKDVKSSVLSEWNDNNQIVYVHNTEKINYVETDSEYGWNENWASDFTNIIFDKTYYTITFDGNGGSFNNLPEYCYIENDKTIKDVIFMENVGELPTPVYEHHEFEGWYLGDTAYHSDTQFSIKNNITLVAKWSDKLYPVTLIDNKYNNADVIVNAVYNNDMPLKSSNGVDLRVPEKEGSVFLGYFTEQGEPYYNVYAGSNQLASSRKYTDIAVNKLYAHWEDIEYTINYIGAERGNNPTTYTISQLPIKFEDPVIDEVGYTAKWNPSELPNGTIGIQNIILEKTPIEYSITYEGADRGNNPTKFTVLTLPIIFEKPVVEAGYTAEWNPLGLSAGTIGNQTVKVEKTAIVYNINYINADSGNNPTTYTVEQLPIEFEKPVVEAGYTAEWDPIGLPIGTTGNQNIALKKSIINYRINYVGADRGNNPTSYTVEQLPIIFEKPVVEAGYTAEWNPTGLPIGSIGDKTISLNKTVIVYSISYNGASRGNNPTTYTVEQLPIVFEKPVVEAGYTAEWDPTGLPIGTTGNKVVTLHNKRAIVYSITYSGAGRGNNPTTYTVEQLPIVFEAPVVEAGYTAEWNPTGLPIGSTGNKTIVMRNKTAIVYTITYSGANRGNNPTTYTVKQLPITFEKPVVEAGYTAEWNSTGLPIGTTGNKIILMQNKTAIVYSINYSGGDRGNNPATYTVEQLPITFKNPTKVGYTGIWNPSGIPRNTTGTFSAKAVWTLIEYDINYVLNGGSNSSYNPNKISIENSPINLISPSRSGYRFMGWYTESNYINEVKTLNYLNLSGDIDVYARWEQLYTLSFYDHESNYLFTDYAIKHEENYRLPDNPYNYLPTQGYWWNGYEFNSYYDVSRDATFYLTDKPLANLYDSSTGFYEIWTQTQLLEMGLSRFYGAKHQIMTDITLDGDWSGIPLFSGYLAGNNYTITYTKSNLAYNVHYGFIIENEGIIVDLNVKPYIRSYVPSSTSYVEFRGIGGIVGVNKGTIRNCTVQSYIGRGNESYVNSNIYVDMYAEYAMQTIGGIAGHNYNIIVNCTNYASIGGQVHAGGIVGINMENVSIDDCNNYGTMYYHMRGQTDCSNYGGIAAYTRMQGQINSCKNYGRLTFAVLSCSPTSSAKPKIAQIVALKEVTSTINSCGSYGVVNIDSAIYSQLYNYNFDYVQTGSQQYGTTYTQNPPSSGGDEGGSCVAEGTFITLADGSQKAVELLTGDEILLVWNMYTGMFDSAPILFIDSEPISTYEVIKLSFSDGTTVDVISEHGFWDVDLNKYVYLDRYASEYIGHSFLKQGENGMMEVMLTNVEINTEVTTAYSPVTYGHLCYYVNGMLSMPGGIDGMFNIFEVDSETMTYDAEAMAADIEKYGLYTYEEFNTLVSVPEEMFDAVNGQYLKVAVGKGLITIEQIQKLVDRYVSFFE